ncbi:MAG: hypothetical protein KDB73_12025 [Planctomycetes bacterium]|nr:hypothetical protein [Planctomycetota bacterium]
MRGALRARWSAFALAALVLLAACGGGGSSSKSPFDFDRSDYPGIVIVPLAAMQERRPTESFSERVPYSGLFNTVRPAADTASDDPFMMDWDTLLGLEANRGTNELDVVRYFLAYEVVESPSAGTCTVIVHVIEGLPFDPTRPPVQSFMGTATYGTQHRAGFTISTPNECADEAAWLAGEAIAASGFFENGWSSGPPDHQAP